MARLTGRIVSTLRPASAQLRQRLLSQSIAKRPGDQYPPEHPSPSTEDMEPGRSVEQGKTTSATSRAPEAAKQTVAEMDEELRQKLENLSGGGGEAGLELEGGKPAAMKRGVRENMFRLI